IPLEGAPRAVLRQIERMPGVRRAEGRLVTEVLMEQEPGRRRRVIARMVTVPPGGEPYINRLRLLEGRPLPEPARNEVLMEVGFAREHHYHPGDRLYVVVSGRRLAATVAGIVSSPEYIYPVRSKQFRMPTPQTFCVLF